MFQVVQPWAKSCSKLDRITVKKHELEEWGSGGVGKMWYRDEKLGFWAGA
ncbi:MAG: hypothetical protein DSM106950_13180 [Stigonema ocellatum SAG 48.90 = DSM 106950]|nr:hypothetical protein [Stigonema ocellatum SAG 48.90 = DSM 106950]